MLRNALLVSSVLCVLILVGCSQTETNTNTATTPANSNKASTTTSSPATTSSGSTTSSTTASSGDKIGLPECDDFIAKYEACITGKVPEAARASYQAGIKSWKESWKQLAANPQTKATLAAACKTAKEQTENSMKTYGCAW